MPTFMEVSACFSTHAIAKSLLKSPLNKLYERGAL
jgi:hypothetical protein